MTCMYTSELTVYLDMTVLFIYALIDRNFKLYYYHFCQLAY